MVDKVLATFVLTNLLFLLSGVLLMVFPLVSEGRINMTPTIGSVAENLLLNQCPLSATVANAVVIFVTFVVSLPAVLMPMTRTWLKIHGYMVLLCAIFTLILGLDTWFNTLRTRSNLSNVWASQATTIQSLLQEELHCCGYLNSTSPPFVIDTTCTTPFVAAQLSGCVGPFSTFANNFLDLIFTAAFGVVGVDVALILSIAMLLKDRTEKERYRHIDEKSGLSGI